MLFFCDVRTLVSLVLSWDSNRAFVVVLAAVFDNEQFQTWSTPFIFRT
jgi:hypothetical protein